MSEILSSHYALAGMVSVACLLIMSSSSILWGFLIASGRLEPLVALFLTVPMGLFGIAVFGWSWDTDFRWAVPMAYSVMGAAVTLRIARSDWK